LIEIHRFQEKVLALATSSPRFSDLEADEGDRRLFSRALISASVLSFTNRLVPLAAKYAERSAALAGDLGDMPTFVWARSLLSAAASFSGGKEALLKWLERDYEEGGQGLMFWGLKTDERFDPVRDDPRFLDLMDKIIEDAAYRPYIDDGTDEGRDRWENVAELRSLAAEYKQEGLEGWVQAKITKASDGLESVYHNLDYKMNFEKKNEPSDMAVEMPFESAYKNNLARHLTKNLQEKSKKKVDDKEVDEADGDPCWKNYKMVGTKKQNGKEVPNCVPK